MAAAAYVAAAAAAVELVVVVVFVDSSLTNLDAFGCCWRCYYYCYCCSLNYFWTLLLAMERLAD